MNDASSEPTGFVYKPLGHGEIRLLNLDAGAGRAPICCSIVHVSLVDNPTYEALSYAWGEPGNERSLFLEGKGVRVRDNLWDALYHLRRQRNHLENIAATLGLHLEEKQRTIWIDALCINQMDIQERNHQVMLMREIYSQAETVIAWLGLPDSGSSMLFNFIKEQGNWFQSEREHQESLSETSVRKAVDNFLDRDYWQRLWVIQEFCLARTLILACGWDQVNWEKFKDWDWPEWHYKFIAGESYFPNLLDLRSRHWTGHHHDLADILRISKRSFCTDPRDRIYGILGLVSERPESRLVIDYSKSLWEVYQDAILYRLTISDSKSVCFANFSAELQQALGNEVANRATMAETSEAELGLGVLIPILATPLGLIKHLGPIYDAHTLQHREDREFWTQVRHSTRGKRNRFRYDEDLTTGFYTFNAEEIQRVIPMSTTEESQCIDEPRFSIDFKAIEGILEQWLYEQPTVTSPTSTEEHRGRMRYTLTDEGYLGLAPLDALKNQLVFCYDSPLSTALNSACIASYEGGGGEMRLVGRSIILQKGQLSTTTQLFPVKLEIDIKTLQLLTF